MCPAAELNKDNRETVTYDIFSNRCSARWTCCEVKWLKAPLKRLTGNIEQMNWQHLWEFSFFFKLKIQRQREMFVRAHLGVELH